MKRAGIAALVLLAVAGLALAIGATDDGDSEGKAYEVVFDNAFGVVDGGDFKVAGVRAGTTSGLEVVTGGRRPLALVKVKITEPGFADLRRDAQCEIRPQSFIGEYFVDCQPGSSGERIPDGGRVPVTQTTSTIPLDLVNNIVRRPYADRLRLIIGELGAGLAGRPEDLSAALRRAHPGLRETTQTLRILARQTRTIERVVSARGHRRRRALQAPAGRIALRPRGRRHRGGGGHPQRELAAAFNRLPRFLGELNPYMLGWVSSPPPSSPCCATCVPPLRAWTRS